MTDSCPRCGTYATATPAPTARFRCPRCRHAWTTSYDPAAYDLTDDTPPQQWADNPWEDYA